MVSPRFRAHFSTSPITTMIFRLTQFTRGLSFSDHGAAFYEDMTPKWRQNLWNPLFKMYFLTFPPFWNNLRLFYMSKKRCQSHHFQWILADTSVTVPVLPHLSSYVREQSFEVCCVGSASCSPQTQGEPAGKKTNNNNAWIKHESELTWDQRRRFEAYSAAKRASE